MSTLLQIVPRVPGGIDGVGDYALALSKNLREKFKCDTVFATFGGESRGQRADFEVLPLERLTEPSLSRFDHILLHYVNYGFQKRGVPFRLLSILRGLRAEHRGKLVTIFHEIYASAPPWRSAFWLQPLQRRLAKSIALLSDVCVVSTENFRRELKRMVPSARLELHPIPSGLGEPLLSNGLIAERNPHQWVIVGGTALVERSLRSFVRLHKCIPESIAAEKLFVLGGNDNAAARSMLSELTIESNYNPRIAATDASQFLATCSFAWFDYFHRRDVETSVILKSSAFAAACAHAVIPVFPHRGSPISLDGDSLPGPFFVKQNRSEIPGARERAVIAAAIYDWYQRYASSEHLLRGIADALDWRPRS